MKKIIYIISLFVSSMLYTSCDALGPAPEDYFGSGNYWNNKAQVEGFMNGMHSQLRGNYNMFYCLGKLRGGTQRVGSSSQNTSLDYAMLRTNTLSQDNPGFSNWFGLYGPIMQANHFIQKVENECDFLSEADRKAYLGQVYGLGVLYHFMLYKTYGGVPIVTTVELLDGKVTVDKLYVERAAPEATMAFVREDIGKPENYLGIEEVTNKYDKTVWSKATILMLKAETHIWVVRVSINGYIASGRSDLETAKTALNGVIGELQLLNKFSDVLSTANHNNAGVVLTLHFADGEITNWEDVLPYQEAVFIGQVYDRDDNRIETDTSDLKGTGGIFRHEYIEDFWKSCSGKDTHRDATFLEYYTQKNKEGSGCVILKAISSINSNDNRTYDIDVTVYRYADTLLMMAEIENGLGNPCVDYINEVRERAYGSSYEVNKCTEGNYAKNELIILQECDKELAWEGKRWLDVVRIHDANSKLLAFSVTADYPPDRPLLDPSEEHKLLWPIDVNIMSVNPLLK